MRFERYCWRHADGSRPITIVDAYFTTTEEAIGWRSQVVEMARRVGNEEHAAWLSHLVLCRETIEEVSDSPTPAPTRRFLACLLNDGETWTDVNRCCVVEALEGTDYDDAAVENGRTVVELLHARGSGTLEIHLHRNESAFDIKVIDHFNVFAS